MIPASIYRVARDAQGISDYLREPTCDRSAKREATEREAASAKPLKPAVPAPAIRQPGGREPGDQYRLFPARREDRPFRTGALGPDQGP